MMDTDFNYRRIFCCLFCILCLTGCSRTYYKTMEKFGYHKRDLLVSRVENANETQQETKEQFKSALEKFSTVLNFHGGKLQDKYEALNREFESSEKKAAELTKRIDSIENVAEDLFAEWENELSQYSNPSLKRSSEQKLRDTKSRYQPMIQAMRRAEKKVDPILDAFRDQVLFLKHNLNAQAVASLKDEYAEVESDISVLIGDMEKSIKEAEQFISAMNATDAA